MIVIRKFQLGASWALMLSEESISNVLLESFLSCLHLPLFFSLLLRLHVFPYRLLQPPHQLILLIDRNIVPVNAHSFRWLVRLGQEFAGSLGEALERDFRFEAGTEDGVLVLEVLLGLCNLEHLILK